MPQKINSAETIDPATFRKNVFFDFIKLKSAGIFLCVHNNRVFMKKSGKIFF